MAAPGSWFRTGTVTVTNGSDVVTGFGTAWRTSATPPESGDIFTVDGKALYEVLAINSDESIKLRKPYEETTATKTAYAIIRNTSATINSRLAAQVTKALNQKQVMIDEQSQWLTSTNATENFTDPLGVAHPVMTPHAMEESVTNKLAAVDSSLGQIVQQHAMTSVQFDALREKRIRDGAGSGYSEPGKHSKSGNANIPINEGLWADTGIANQLQWGIDSKISSVKGISRTSCPVVVADGIEITINAKPGDSYPNRIKFAPAPNGTKTRDSVTGVVTTHADATTAFAAETATNKVIVSRQDIVGLKIQKEVDLDLYDVFFPNGSTQYGKSSWNGISLVDVTTLGVPQALCGFGEWDTTTKGKGVKFSTLSDANKKKVLADPKNNIRYDAVKDKLVFTLVKAVSVEGIGDGWEDARLGKFDSKAWLSSALDQDWSTTQDYQPVDGDAGRKDGTHSMFVPIALVQRFNQGLYSGEFNDMGCGCIGSGKYLVNYRPKSRLECFTLAANGSISSGKTGRYDQYKYFDAIYAGLVVDLRLSSHVQNESKLLVDSINKVFNGTMRGKGKVPFWRFGRDKTSAKRSGSSSGYVYVLDARSDSIPSWFVNELKISGWLYSWHSNGSLLRKDKILQIYNSGVDTWAWAVDIEDASYAASTSPGDGRTYSVQLFNELSAEYDSLPMVNIIGDNARIAAVFPNGCVGERIEKDLSSGSYEPFDFTRKLAVNNGSFIYTDNDGVSWTVATNNVDEIRNTFSTTANPNRVALQYYESQSYVTKAANNLPVVGGVGCVLATEDSRLDYGNRLLGSLTGLIGKDAASSSDASSQRLTLLSYGLTPDGKLDGVETGEIKHDDLTLGAPANNSQGVKCVFTLAEVDGLLTLQAMGNALAHNGTDWGDDGKITAVDGEGVKTNDNGAKVKTFCHQLMIPLGIASHNNSAQS